MSYDSEDEAREHFCDEIYAQVSKEVIEDFTIERLRAGYDQNPAIAEKAFKSLAEACALSLTRHQTAAFIHAAIASEVTLRSVVLKPIICGFIHNDSMAPLIVDLAFGSTGLERYKSLFNKVFRDVSNLDLMTYKRTGGAKTLWEEINDIQRLRNLIMHQGDFITPADAAKAVAVASAVVEDLFPALAKSLGYHLHDGFRLCRDSVCSLPPEIRKRLAQLKASPSGVGSHT